MHTKLTLAIALSAMTLGVAAMRCPCAIYRTVARVTCGIRGAGP